MSCIDVISKHYGEALKKGDWGSRHCQAWNDPPTIIEKGIVDLIKASAHYADYHFRKHCSWIGEDGVLGKGWVNILKGIRTLLNGSLGDLDGGTLDATILEMAESQRAEII